MKIEAKDVDQCRMIKLKVFPTLMALSILTMMPYGIVLSWRTLTASTDVTGQIAMILMMLTLGCVLGYTIKMSLPVVRDFWMRNIVGYSVCIVQKTADVLEYHVLSDWELIGTMRSQSYDTSSGGSFLVRLSWGRKDRFCGAFVSLGPDRDMSRLVLSDERGSSITGLTPHRILEFARQIPSLDLRDLSSRVGMLIWKFTDLTAENERLRKMLAQQQAPAKAPDSVGDGTQMSG